MNIIPPIDLGPDPTELHSEPCISCSFHHGCMDPEAEQVEQWIAEGEDWREHAFRCAWRPEKLCYSFSKYM